MKKKFILWLCKVFKVELVEPIKQINRVEYIHEKHPYTLIQDVVRLNRFSFPTGTQDHFITLEKRDMLYRCMQQLEEKNIISFEHWEDPLEGDINIRCSFYAAPTKVN